MKPRVAPEKRPSVSSATELAEALRRRCARGDREHLAHARAAGRALVADHDDVAGAGCRSPVTAAIARLLALEDARRARVVAALVAARA